MSAVAERTSNVTISLEAGCMDDGCRGFAAYTHAQLANGDYTWPCSAMILPDTFADYMAQVRTGRKRAWRAARLGYTFAEIDRSVLADEIFEINTSLPERQGRPMSDAYQTRQTYSPLPVYPCPRHHIRTYGVFAPAGQLVAYTVVYRVGALVMFSQILGHGAHLEYDVMYLLVSEALRDQMERGGPGVAWYNMHSSGTDGLRYFKEKLGLWPTRVEWELA